MKKIYFVLTDAGTALGRIIKFKTGKKYTHVYMLGRCIRRKEEWLSLDHAIHGDFNFLLCDFLHFPQQTCSI